MFQTKKHAEAIAFSRSIEDLMRSMEGCCMAEDNKEQYIISVTTTEERGDSVRPERMMSLSVKLYCNQFGVFNTKSAAQNAIDSVGAEKLVRAAKAKVGIY